MGFINLRRLNIRKRNSCASALVPLSDVQPPSLYKSHILNGRINKLYILGIPVFTLSLSCRQEAQKANKVKLKFRTHHTNGMLMYQGQGHTASDYLILAIVNSQVELSFNLGMQDQENLFIMRSTVLVSDGVWHSVIVER